MKRNRLPMKPDLVMMWETRCERSISYSRRACAISSGLSLAKGLPALCMASLMKIPSSTPSCSLRNDRHTCPACCAVFHNMSAARIRTVTSYLTSLCLYVKAYDNIPCKRPHTLTKHGVFLATC